MMNSHSNTITKNDSEKGKILLALMPLWSTLIPPLGISYLKSFLQEYGYVVKTVDANTDAEVAKVFEKYLTTLKEYTPENKRGNFTNIGLEVLRNHMMAGLNYKDQKEYAELIKVLVYKTFYFHIDDEQVFTLNEVVKEIYLSIKKFFIDLLTKEKPDVVGLSVLRDNVAASLYAFQLTKEFDPGIKTVMGGGIFANDLATYTPDFKFFIENTPYIDKFIIGEGERLLLNILQNEFSDTQKVYSVKDVGGEYMDYSSIGIPDFADFDLQKYAFLGAEASTSCPYHCSFCNVVNYWGKYRKKSAKQATGEMLELYNRYGHQLFFMTDFIMNPSMNELSEAFSNIDVPIYWDGHLRVDKSVCDIENTMRWRKGGFYRARMGLESGSQKMLDAMGKSITPEQSKRALTSLAHAGIKTTTYWVIGHPDETEEDFQMTLDFIEQNQDFIYEAECHPFMYAYSGQANSDEWEGHRQFLYPAEARDMLMIQSYDLNNYPSREEKYERVNRFVEHCKKLGIYYSYSIHEIYKADKRWERLHKNAVPSVVEFKDRGSYVSEKNNVKRLAFAKEIQQEDTDFAF